MTHLDSFENAKARISKADPNAVLFDDELAELEKLTGGEIDRRIRRFTSAPLCDEDFTVVYTLYSRLKWLDALGICLQSSGGTVLEIGSGSTAGIPYALTMLDASSRYITANMNKDLTEGLRRNTAALPITIDIIEDDANNISEHLPPGSVDMIVFEHSVNDAVQAILCANRGIDTAYCDWFGLLPDMIRMINAEYGGGTLDQSAKPAFVSLVKNCLQVLRPGGYLAMSHYMFQYDLDLGYDPVLWENFLDIIRPWLSGIADGNEVAMDAFDPKWWLFFRKNC